MKEIAAKLVLRTLGLLWVATLITSVTLKLTGILPWSWWWILAPVWGAILIALVLLGLFALAVALLASEAKSGKKGGII